MIHLNGNLLCAIDTETTGLTPYHHEVIQVAVLPLDFTLKPHAKYMPFEMRIKPNKPENVDYEALAVNKQTLWSIMANGMEYDRAADLFIEWFERLKLPEGKKISPLAQNWPHDSPFLKDWLGTKNYDYCIDGRFRDTMSTALFINDYCDATITQIPFPKVNQRYLATTLNIESPGSGFHDALGDCQVTAEIYRNMVYRLKAFAP